MKDHTMVFFSDTQKKFYIPKEQFDALKAEGRIYRICGKYVV